MAFGFKLKKPDRESGAAASMAAVYALNGGAQFIAAGTLAIFLSWHPFVSNMGLGLIVALASLVTAVAQPMWGVIGDYARTKNRVLAGVYICIACMSWLFILPRHTGYFTIVLSVIAVYSVVYVPTPLTDSIVVENLDKIRLRYGIIRAFGAGGAALTAFALFLMNSAAELEPKYSFLILFGATLLSLVPLKFLPPAAGHAYKARRGAADAIAGADSRLPAGPLQNAGESAGANSLPVADGGLTKPGFNLSAVFKNKQLMLLLAYGLFTFTCTGCQNTFFSVYYATDRGLNAGIGMYGLFFTVCIAAEAAVMVIGSKWYSRMGIYTVLTLVQLASCLRALVVYFSPNPYIMFVMALFHGHLFGLLFLRVAPYINSIVPEEMRATGQACWTVMMMGLGPVFGSTLGGFIANWIGIRDIFLLTAAASLAIAVVFFVLFRRQPQTAGAV